MKGFVQNIKTGQAVKFVPVLFLFHLVRRYILKSRNVDTKKIVLDWSGIKHFKPSEFDSPDKVGSGNNMDHEFIKMLDKARSLAAVPFTVTSGFRTKDYNTGLTGSSPTSSHMIGKAADIRCVSMDDMKRKAKACYQAGFRRFGLYEWKTGYHIHVDNDTAKMNTTWSKKRGQRLAINFFNPKNL